jgi:ParE toxin of type II toxin-antitoxin system, parDE
MAHLLSRQVKAELDDIWSYVAVESGSIDVADRIVDGITETFLQISKYPNLRPSTRRSPQGTEERYGWDLRRHLSRGGQRRPNTPCRARTP